MNPIEIAAKAAFARVMPNFQWEDNDEATKKCYAADALAIIAALEAAGAKVMWREPTEEMVAAALTQIYTGLEWDEKTCEVSCEAVIAALTEAHDAAPRYGEPRSTQGGREHGKG